VNNAVTSEMYEVLLSRFFSLIFTLRV